MWSNSPPTVLHGTGRERERKRARERERGREREKERDGGRAGRRTIDYNDVEEEVDLLCACSMELIRCTLGPKSVLSFSHTTR